MSYTYEYPKADHTVDIIVYRESGEVLEILLIKRGGEPFKGCWALPGGFLNMNETLEEAAARELKEETGIQIRAEFLEQVGTYSDVDRDPRGRVISTVFLISVPSHTKAKAGDDAKDAQWFRLTDRRPPLAFDHERIIRDSGLGAVVCGG